MDKMNLAYCNECEDLVEFTEQEEIVEEYYRGELVRFRFKVGRCKECGHEVATDIDYNTRRSEEKIEAYNIPQLSPLALYAVVLNTSSM